MSKKLLSLSFCIFLFVANLLAQNGVITGTVSDAESKVNLDEVIVKIEHSNWSTKTDDTGQYALTNIKPGKYYLIFIKKSYYSLVVPDVEVINGKRTTVNVDMYPGNENEFLFLEIGGIRVTADRELLSEEPETVHRISSGEIEHMQANSLADVLSMVPGNEVTQSLGLARPQKIAIRDFNEGGDRAASFGTKIIVDDVPLSNNADLQTGVGVGYGTNVQKTNNEQYDLREVVAENIEKVEVMAGASSVEYGDHTQGIIKVKTRTENVPTRLKLKSNPDTREANLMGGFDLLNTNLVYNFNYGYSERDIRITGDEYHRIAGNLSTKNHFMADALKLRQSLRYTRKIEEDNDDSDPYGVKAYNRDHHITYSHNFEYEWNKVLQLYWRNFIDYKKRNSWRRRLESMDLSVVTDRVTPGTIEGIRSEPSYFSEVRTRGDEWTYGSKLKWTQNFFTGEILNRLLVGAEFQVDDNTGPGKSWDILRPPGGNAKARPRSFNDTPGIFQLAFFAEDRLTGTFVFPYTLDLGFRIDSYNPRGFSLGKLFEGEDVFDAKQGSFFNPRVGLKLKLTDKTQLRLTYSKSSKTPPISAIYPEDYYLDVFDYTTRQVPDTAGSVRDTNITLVSTYVYDRTSLDLDGYQSTKMEAAVDQEIGDFGFSLTGYYQKDENTHRNVGLPITYYRYYWENWPNTTSKQIDETITTASAYQQYFNLGMSDGYGFEFSIRSHRIKPLNMRFRINAAYNFKNYNSKNYRAYSSTRRLTAGDTLASGWVVPEDMQVVPYYKPYGRWRQKMVVNYHIDYIAEPLGIWFTFRAQQVLYDRDLARDNPTIHAEGYYYEGDNIDIDQETSTLMGLDRSFDPFDLQVDRSKPNDKWLFSIVASKSLFKGAEISLFVENVLNDRAYYKNRQGYYRSRNPEIYWGVAFSSKLDDLF